MSQASLEQLHDIVLPTEPGIWPLALGWWLLIIILAVSIFLVTNKIVTHYKFWSIKRRALAMIPSCNDCNDLNQLLKQVVIHYCHDDKVSVLTGSDWVDFISLNLEASSKDSLTTIIDALYTAHHAKYFDQYHAITKQWLSNLNARTLLTMQNAIKNDKSTENNNVNV